MSVKSKSGGRQGKKDSPAFEEDLKRLEDLLYQLEHGDLPLEAALAAFEEGMQLVRRANAKLDEVEQKVEVLLRDEDGRLVARPFAAPEDSDD